MHDIRWYGRRLAAFGAAMAIAAAPAIAGAAPPSPEPDAAQPRLGEGFSIEAFTAPYQRLMKADKAECMERSPQREATALWYSLREELLGLNARIEAFKLEAKQFDGQRQERALQGLARLGAERERVLGRHVRALGELPPAKPAGSAAAARSSAERIGIEFVVEDIDDGSRN